MRASTARLVFAPSQGYVCLSCRLQSAALRTGRSRRYQHSSRSQDEASNDKVFQTVSDALKDDRGAESSSSSTIREVIKGFFLNDSTKAGGKFGHLDGDRVGSRAVTRQEV